MIYLDMDGVTADFNAGLARFGLVPRWNEVDIPRDRMTPDQLDHDDRIKKLMATPGFFEWLPPMPDAHELWEFCSRVDPGFVTLTARPKDPRHADRVAREKRAMIHRVFGPIAESRFICCLASEKGNFVGHRPGPVQALVDDRPKLCQQWADAGGLAILHTSARDSIRQLAVAHVNVKAGADYLKGLLESAWPAAVTA